MSDDHATQKLNQEIASPKSNEGFVFDPRQSFSVSVFSKLGQLPDLAVVMTNLDEVNPSWSSSSIDFHHTIRALFEEEFEEVLSRLPANEYERSCLLALRNTRPRMPLEALDRFHRGEAAYNLSLEMFVNPDYTMEENAYFSTAAWNLDVTLDWMYGNMMRRASAIEQAQPTSG